MTNLKLQTYLKRLGYVTRKRKDNKLTVYLNELNDYSNKSFDCKTPSFKKLFNDLSLFDGIAYLNELKIEVKK